MSGLEFFRQMMAGEVRAAADGRAARHSGSSKPSDGPRRRSPASASERFYNGMGRRARRVCRDAARFGARLRDQHD